MTEARRNASRTVVATFLKKEAKIRLVFLTSVACGIDNKRLWSRPTLYVNCHGIFFFFFAVGLCFIHKTDLD